MLMTGARAFCECLKREGVDIFFGYPGAVLVELYHEMRNYPDLQQIIVRHEQGAAHAADGYSRASGKVGVCLLTSGPGATNIVTGLAAAYADSIPMVAITGQVPTSLIGNDAFQEVDIVGITRPCTKHNFLLKDANDLPKVMRQAFHIARSGRPGPVLIDFPKDVMVQTFNFEWPEEVRMRSYNPTYKPNLNQIRRAAELVLASKRPLFLVGGGVILSNASEGLREIARTYQIPVTPTLMGLGAFPGSDPLSLGMLGMHGTYVANKAVNNADLLIAVGARFDDRVTGKLEKFAPNAEIIHIDIDPTSIRKNVAVNVPVVGDCGMALAGLAEALTHKLEQSGQSAAQICASHTPWLEQLSIWQTEQPISYPTPTGSSLRPQQVVEAVQRMTGGNAIITTEVGQNQMWAAQFMKVDYPRTFITSGGLGVMGYGLPAAIGAQLACPGKQVIDIAGDGSIQMNIQELIVAVSNNLPVKVVILNNRYLGLVRQWQDLFYNKEYAFTSMEAQPDFVKLAEAYGAEGYRITNAVELESILPKALSSPKAALIDIHVEREENVYPMVPAGAALDDMLLV